MLPRNKGQPAAREPLKLVRSAGAGQASLPQAHEWYVLRWKIEVFHKIMKSGCRAEAAKLRTAERLVTLIAMFCIMGWGIFWMTMLNRSTTEALPRYALSW